jgi:hypothetical protein
LSKEQKRLLSKKRKATMNEPITKYLINVILEKENIKNFYEVLTKLHYHSEDDFQLKTNYAIILFVETLFLDENDGFKGLKLPYALECQLYEELANSKLKMFHYVTFKASAHNDLNGLRSLIDDYKKDNWTLIFGYYVHNKTLDLLTSNDDCFDIKKKIYATICSIKEEKMNEVTELCTSCEQDECSICLQVMDPSSTMTTLCNHTYHRKCLYPMFDEAVKKYSTKPKISCPLCRADVFIKAKLSLLNVTHY